MFRRLTRTQLIVDVGVAVLCLLLRLTLQFDSPVVVVVVLGMAAALAIRRLSPGLALSVAWVAAILQMVALLSPDFSNLAIPAVLYTTARYGSRTAKWAGLVSALAGAVIATVYVVILPAAGLGLGSSNPIGLGFPQIMTASSASLIGALAVLGLSWTLGQLARIWANAREASRAQVEAERIVVVEQERNRIARDMHDVVAHSLAVVIAQADGARYTKAAAAKDEALVTIASTAREALADVRLLLGQLRHSEEVGPQPVLADLDRLVEQVRASGLIVALEQRGAAVPLPHAHQLAIYRIVQEALTNALRHGDTSEEVVALLDWAPDAMTVTISNATLPGAPAAHGHGVAGMTERTQLFGGTLTAASVVDHFVVTARIPVPE